MCKRAHGEWRGVRGDRGMTRTRYKTVERQHGTLYKRQRFLPLIILSVGRACHRTDQPKNKGQLEPSTSLSTYLPTSISLPPHYAALRGNALTNEGDVGVLYGAPQQKRREELSWHIRSSLVKGAVFPKRYMNYSITARSKWREVNKYKENKKKINKQARFFDLPKWLASEFVKKNYAYTVYMFIYCWVEIFFFFLFKRWVVCIRHVA